MVLAYVLISPFPHVHITTLLSPTAISLIWMDPCHLLQLSDVAGVRFRNETLWLVRPALRRIPMADRAGDG